MRSETGRLFPMFVDIAGCRVLVAGGGVIASRRVRTLLEFGPEICVAAPESSGILERLAGEGRITLLRRPWREEDLDGACFVLAATDDAALNEKIAGCCRARKIPVNVCSDQDLCDFQFPSVVIRGELTVGLNASGRDHSLVKSARIEVEKCLGGEDIYE